MNYHRYNFDHPVNRLNTCSVKWDENKKRNMLPLWVADMDFRTAPEITQAIVQRAEHGVFGYTHVPDEYYKATAGWFMRRHNWAINTDSIIYTSGVVPALSAIIKALAKPGQNVIIQTPVYNCFFSSIRNNGCNAVHNPLIYTGNTYEIDFDDLEKKAADPNTTLMILCNPANPAGRVWTPQELTRIGQICIKNGVTVIADEIHCELVYSPSRYTPFASLSPEFAMNSVTCISPSKAFNIAGLMIANIVADDPAKREAINRAININEVCDVNIFGVTALIAAYETGEEWLTELIDYLEDNYKFMLDFCKEFLPAFPVAELQGTYLAWMDIRATGMTSQQLSDTLKDTASLWLNAGTMYGPEGEGFIRWNLACPRVTLTEALTRFRNAVKPLLG